MTKTPKILKKFTSPIFDANGEKSGEHKLALVEPNAKVLKEAKWKYSAAFSNALRQGLLTEKRMSELISEGEAVTDKDSTRLAALYIRIAELENTLENEKDLSEKTKIISEMKDLRQEVNLEQVSIRAPYSNTAEQAAEDSRADFLVTNMVKYEDSMEKVWNSEEDYYQETDYSLIELCKSKLMYWLYNLDEDWEDQLPENRAQVEMIEEITKGSVLKEKEEEHEDKSEEKEPVSSKKPNKPKKVAKTKAASA